MSPPCTCGTCRPSLQTVERNAELFLEGVLPGASRGERLALASILASEVVGVLPGFDYKPLFAQVERVDDLERLLSALHQIGRCEGLAGRVIVHEVLKRRGLIADWRFVGLDAAGELRLEVSLLKPVDFIPIPAEALPAEPKLV